MAISSLSATGKGGYLGQIGGLPGLTTRTPSGTTVRYSPSRSSVGTGLVAPQVRSAADLVKTANPFVAEQARIRDAAISSANNLLKQTLGQGRAPVVMGPSGGYVAANPLGVAPNIMDNPLVAAQARIRDIAIGGAADKARADIYNRLLMTGNPFFTSKLTPQGIADTLRGLGLSSQAINEASGFLSLTPEQQNAMWSQYGTPEETAVIRKQLTPGLLGAPQTLTPAEEQTAAVIRDIGPSGTGLAAQLARSFTKAGRAIGGAVASRDAFRSGEVPTYAREFGLQKTVAEQAQINDLLSAISKTLSDRASANAAAEQTLQDLITKIQAGSEFGSNVGETVTNTPRDLAAEAAARALKRRVVPAGYQAGNERVKGVAQTAMPAFYPVARVAPAATLAALRNALGGRA